MSTDLTPTEYYKSLNGFDEIAIRRAFGDTAETLGETDNMMLARALVFTDYRRQGKNDAEAKQLAMETTNGDVTAYFADEPEEVVPEAPTSDAGKDS